MDGVGRQPDLWLGAVKPHSHRNSSNHNKLSGLGALKEFVLVVLPLIWPTFVTMVTLSLIGFFGATGSVLVFTQGKRGHYDNFLLDVPHFAESGRIDVPYFQRGGLITMLITVPVVFVGRFIMNKWGQEIEY